MLPGNEIMLGRWWRAGAGGFEEEVSYSGPFVFWRVEGTPEERLRGVESAVEFMESAL